jgi:phage shock protein A
MTIIKKLVTLLRGSARELGQSVVDGNATRIYEQEIVDAKRSITEAKAELTTVMAKEMQTARDMERLRGEIRRHEDLALQALDKSEGLALEVAERVAGLEAELQAQTEAHANFAMQVARLKDLIRAAETKVREHEREIGIAKTTESVYRATQSISDSIGATGSNLVSARESLERIKKRHEDLADRMAAAEQLDQEFGHKALERKLAEAGIGEGDKARAADVMARIKAKRDAGTAASNAGETASAATSTAAAPSLPAPQTGDTAGGAAGASTGGNA